MESPVKETKSNISKSEPLPNASPAYEMPDCWTDDVRMNALFAPFRQRTVNPLDYDLKIEFWKKVVNDWCLHQNSPSFQLADLRKAFLRNGCVPLCLPTVIDEMFMKKELVLRTDFVNVPPEKSWSAWTVDLLVKKPIGWSLNKVKEYVVTPTTKGDEVYVNLAAAKKQGEALLLAAEDSMKNQVYELKEFSNLYKEKSGTSEDVELAIHWLRQSGKIAMTESSEGNLLIKLAASADKKAVISDLDMRIYALKLNEAALIRNLEELEADKQTAVSEAKAYLKKGMRQVAKTSLRKKHELEKNIDKRNSALSNVQLLLERIREAETDGKVLEAYKLGSSTLKTLFKEAGLTEDSVAHTVTEVEEALDIHDEIQATLAQPIGPTGDRDLEDELEALLLADSGSTPPPLSPVQPPKKSAENKDNDLEARLQALRTPSFPDPPSFTPSPLRQKQTPM